MSIKHDIRITVQRGRPLNLELGDRIKITEEGKRTFQCRLFRTIEVQEEAMVVEHYDFLQVPDDPS
jgi:hypothetical protein